MADDDTTPPDNLISFASFKDRAQAAGPVTRKPRTYRIDKCDHRRFGFSVDEEEHTVECDGCGRVVDPFTAVLAIMRWDWETARESRVRAVKESERLHAEIDKLKALRGKEKAGVALPGKFVRNALRNLAEQLKRNGAMDRAQGDKSGAQAFESAAHCVRDLGERLVDGLLKEAESDG